MMAETEASRASEPTDRFRAGLLALAADPERRIYAVLDGALLADLPSRLRKAGLRHRSLVASSAERDLVLTGPWMVDPSHVALEPPVASNDANAPDMSDEALERRAAEMAEEAARALEEGDERAFSGEREDGWQPAEPGPGIEAILDLAGGTSGLVFWCGDRHLTPTTLFSHLRGIGRVLLTQGSQGEGEEEWVLFRHADAQVLDQVLPALDDARLSRFLGPAGEVLFRVGETPRRARRISEMPPSTDGPLRLDAATLDAVRGARAALSVERIARYLRGAAPDRTGALTDAQMRALIAESDGQARELGIRTERGRGRFAYLTLLTGGEAGRMPAVRAVITNGERSPDEQVRRLIAESAAAVARGGGAR